MIVKRDFIYTPKGASRPLHIWLPEDYFDSTHFYPVMYFLTATISSPTPTPLTAKAGA